MVSGGVTIKGASTITRAEIRQSKGEKVAQKMAGAIDAASALETLEAASTRLLKGKRLAIYDRTNTSRTPRFVRQYLISRERAQHTVAVVRTLFSTVTSQIADEQTRSGLQQKLDGYLTSDRTAIRGEQLQALVAELRSAYDASQSNAIQTGNSARLIEHSAPQLTGPDLASVDAYDPSLQVLQQLGRVGPVANPASSDLVQNPIGSNESESDMLNELLNEQLPPLTDVRHRKSARDLRTDLEKQLPEPIQLAARAIAEQADLHHPSISLHSEHLTHDDDITMLDDNKREDDDDDYEDVEMRARRLNAEFERFKVDANQEVERQRQVEQWGRFATVLNEHSETVDHWQGQLRLADAFDGRPSELDTPGELVRALTANIRDIQDLMNIYDGGVDDVETYQKLVRKGQKLCGSLDAQLGALDDQRNLLIEMRNTVADQLVDDSSTNANCDELLAMSQALLDRGIDLIERFNQLSLPTDDELRARRDRALQQVLGERPAELMRAQTRWAQFEQGNFRDAIKTLKAYPDLSRLDLAERRLVDDRFSAIERHFQEAQQFRESLRTIEEGLRNARAQLVEWYGETYPEGLAAVDEQLQTVVSLAQRTRQPRAELFEALALKKSLPPIPTATVPEPPTNEGVQSLLDFVAALPVSSDPKERLLAAEQVANQLDLLLEKGVEPAPGQRAKFSSLLAADGALLRRLESDRLTVIQNVEYKYADDEQLIHGSDDSLTLQEKIRALQALDDDLEQVSAEYRSRVKSLDTLRAENSLVAMRDNPERRAQLEADEQRLLNGNGEAVSEDAPPDQRMLSLSLEDLSVEEKFIRDKISALTEEIVDAQKTMEESLAALHRERDQIIEDFNRLTDHVKATFSVVRQKLGIPQ